MSTEEILNELRQNKELYNAVIRDLIQDYRQRINQYKITVAILTLMLLSAIGIIAKMWL